MVKIIYKDGNLIVDTPYVSDIPSRFRKMGGNWDGSYWVFNNEPVIKTSLEKFLTEKFGFKIGCKTAPVIITVKKNIYMSRDSIIFAGCVLAAARGRDTGAKLGDGVLLIEGDINSGGSVKNWTSEIKKGSKFLIKEFPVEFSLDEENYLVEFQESATEETKDKEKDFSGFTDDELINELIKRNYIVNKKLTL